MAIAGVAGVGEQPLAARIGEAGEGQVEGAGSAVGDGDPAGGHCNAMAAAIEGGDRGTQRRQAKRFAVFGFPLFYGVDRSVRDGLGGREIRFADLHVDDVATLRFQLSGAGKQFDHVKGLDAGEPAGGAIAHGDPQ